ncbi:MAG: 2-hydroxyglutaryl-CoA dehydratase [Clostridia bacterium]|nr:2-hydroxyglutaryl-CoA dehydratase [Clostridia bacterium]
MTAYYVGIDVGSVSTNLVLLDEQEKVFSKLYLRTQGQPIRVLTEGLKLLKNVAGKDYTILGAGVTGSGRQLAATMTKADIMKNEITAHAIAALHCCPNVNTVFEIGGQDSKIIFICNGVVSDFAMNTVCAAGTGSFLDRQAARLNIPIEEFGGYALKSQMPVQIAGRCAVFAESDMIHKQQTGHSTEDIVNGLCMALVRNYLNNLAKGKTIKEPVVFQGGVAANVGIIAAFERELQVKITVPEHYDVMGAIGAALLAKEEVKNRATTFRGFDNLNSEFVAKSFECNNCANKCEVVELMQNNCAVARWGDRCGRWSSMDNEVKEKKVEKQKTATLA